MTLQLLHSDFPYIWGKFDFLFYQWITTYYLEKDLADKEREGADVKSLLKEAFRKMDVEQNSTNRATKNSRIL
jgi:hypothetical protein